MTLARFQRRIRQIADQIEENVPDIARKAAIAIDQAVVLATPVDTGRARSNWQIGIGAAPSGAREAFSPGQGGDTEGANTRAALDDARRKINTGRDGADIHITNNLDYIGRLNEGSSEQAPAGFVEDAVMIGTNTIKRSKVID